MLKHLVAAGLVGACTTNTGVVPDEASTQRGPVHPVTASLWSSAVGDASAMREPGRWLASSVRDGEPVVVVLGDDGVRFEDAQGRRLAIVAAADFQNGAFDSSRSIVWLGGRGRMAAIDLLADTPRIAVLSETLPHDGYAVQLSRAPVIAPELSVGVDAFDEPGGAYALLEWSSAAPSLTEIVVSDDGEPAIGRPVARWDRRWLAARAERVAWPRLDDALSSRHDDCPHPHGELDCQPFGSGSLWMIATHEEMGDVLHVDVVLYDAARERWAVPRDDVAPLGLKWSERAPAGVEFAAEFDRSGRVFTTASHVCRVDAGCRRIEGEALGFLGGSVRVGAEE